LCQLLMTRPPPRGAAPGRDPLWCLSPSAREALEEAAPQNSSHPLARAA
jgi:hypothetical protein